MFPEWKTNALIQGDLFSDIQDAAVGVPPDKPLQLSDADVAGALDALAAAPAPLVVVPSPAECESVITLPKGFGEISGDMPTAVTAENYFTDDVQREFVTRSQVKDFIECPAWWKAKTFDGWAPEGDSKNVNFVVGHYVEHALIGDTVAAAKYIAENEDVIWGSAGRFYQRDCKGGKKGEQKQMLAPFQQADLMIAKAKSSPEFMAHLVGAAQQAFTATLFGVRVAILCDWIQVPDHTDLKTCASIQAPLWCAKRRKWLPFWEWNNYWLQFAFYDAVLQANGMVCRHRMAAISKETPPDIDVLLMNDRGRMDFEISRIRPHLEQMGAAKADIDGAQLRRCELCEYCRGTRTFLQARPIFTEQRHCPEMFQDGDFEL